MKQNKIIILMAIVLLLVIGTFFVYFFVQKNRSRVPQETSNLSSVQVTSRVIEFGSRLKNVSLLSPNEILKKDIQLNYGTYITSELLNKWLNDPTQAPGRQTSSPWPDRIEVTSVNQVDQNHFEIEGQVVYMTNQELQSGGDAGRYLVKINLINQNGNWLISDFLQNQNPTDSPCALGNCPFEIREQDNGRTFTYSETSRFTVVLDSTKYPPEELKCSPDDVTGRISNSPAVSPPLYAATFEAVSGGQCVLQDRGFKVNIVVVGLE